MSKKLMGIIAAVIIVVIVVGAVAWMYTAPRPTQTLAMGTGATSGAFFFIGGGVSKVSEKYVPGYMIRVEVTGGTIDNLKLFSGNKIQIGFAAGDGLEQAYQGTAFFQDIGPQKDLRVITKLNTGFMHFAFREESGIKSLSDVKEKKPAIAHTVQTGEYVLQTYLDSLGMKMDDVKRFRLSTGECTDAVKNRVADGLMIPGSVPFASILDLTSAPGLKVVFVQLTDKDLEAISKSKYYTPTYYPFTLSAGTYPQQNYPVKGVGYGNYLVCKADLSEEFVYQLTKAMYEHKAELVLAHKSAEELDLQNPVLGSPVPAHPGAIKYYKEKGVWKGP